MILHLKYHDLIHFLLKLQASLSTFVVLALILISQWCSNYRWYCFLETMNFKQCFKLTDDWTLMIVVDPSCGNYYELIDFAS